MQTKDASNYPTAEQPIGGRISSLNRNQTLPKIKPNVAKIFRF